MQRVAKLSLLVVLALSLVLTGCATVKHLNKTPARALKIQDYVYFHNVSITYDGNHYFTINGGNTDYCRINEYSKNGKFLKSYDLGIDGRTIFFNPNDGELYAKVYGDEVYMLDLEGNGPMPKLAHIFDEDNSSPGISPNGKFFYELSDGKITVLNARTGRELRSFRIDRYHDQHAYNLSIAASQKHLFVWGGEDRVVVYDLSGKYVSTITLTRSGYPFSLSYCNDMLWISKDADASTEGGYGYWYGYRLYQ